MRSTRFSAVATAVAVAATAGSMALAQLPKAKGTAAAKEAAVALNSVEVRLFLEGRGEFSPDILPLKDFGTRNFETITSAFPADRFSSILIKVGLKTAGEAFLKGRQVKVSLVYEKTKKVAWTRTISDVYIGSSGRVSRVLLAEDKACGPFKLIVTAGKATVEHTLHFSCGE
ncbi:MAG TPA: hypothetical protein PK264_21310 [Hyphomicrobiaceae bacterium]|nr:hypothetical protein [Hyphomicrobiaceae bacterium]